ncbi:MAG: hypothetical protein IJ069_01395 [Prevotella sp.]|nr:hypothetical protein [Prevotella sp.]
MSKKICSFVMLLMVVLFVYGQMGQGGVSVNDDKHSETYIRQRVDIIYGRYQNPVYDEYGIRLMDNSVNYDSAFCTSRYMAMMRLALEKLNDEEPLFDYDHWTNSQDDNNFTYTIKEVSNITDSTAVITITAHNFDNDYPIMLRLLFERDDWYVDDFLATDGVGSDKDYFQDIIKNYQ